MRRRRRALTDFALAHVSARELKRLGVVTPPPNVETSVAPAVANALERLRRRVGDEAWAQAAPHARLHLARHITSRLATLIGPSLGRFGRMVGYDVPAAAENMTAECVDEDTSDASLAAGQNVFLDAVSSFPAFAETVHLLVIDWINAHAELLLRFKRDRMQLIRADTCETSTGAITGIVPGLSDAHDGCRTVTRLQLYDGTEIIYKPRCCSGEALWNRTLGWINSEGFQPAFKVLQIASRSGYGWVQLVRPEPCDSIDAVHRAFHRWGALTAVAEALGCVDLHHENWIQVGEHPMLVDAESYGKDAWRVRRHGGRGYGLPPFLQTGLFPMRAEDGMPEYRGIAPFDTLASMKSAPAAWPVFAGKAYIPHEHADEVAAGYAAMFTFLHRCRSRTDRIAYFARQAAQRRSNRQFVRSTEEYQRLLRESLSDFELFGAPTRYERLLQRCAASAPSRLIATAEANALLRCSVPRFTNTHFRRTTTCRQPPRRSAVRAIRERLASLIYSG